MEARLIKTEEQYRAALTEVENLIALDPAPDTSAANRLDVLSLLLEKYEKEQFPIRKPNAIEAIIFRMEEQGLLQKDLVHILGSKSKVSEVLSGKRKLTLQMIRLLHEELDIPLEILVNDPEKTNDVDADIDWKKFPLLEMIKRGWLSKRFKNVYEHAEELMQEFLAPIGGTLPRAVMFRGTNRNVDEHSLLAWISRVLIRAKNECCPSEYVSGSINKDFMKEVVRLSWFEKGPVLVHEFLLKHGIAFIVEPALSKTKLDGGTILTENGPVIGLTVRHDRIDSFWFTLLHELAHISLHLRKPNEMFVDIDIEKEMKDDTHELEANKLARESIVPRVIWTRTDAFRERTPEAINALAKELKIHPALIAGRIRYESNNYRILNDFVSHGKIRKLFDDINWGKKE